MRSELTLTVARSTDGQPLTGIGVEVLNRSDDSPAVVYESPVGAALPSNILVTNQGNVTGWLETGSYKLVISHPSIETYTEYFEAVAGDDVKELEASDTAAEQRLFISDDAPINPPTTYMWIETGLGTGDDFTIWFEDAT